MKYFFFNEGVTGTSKTQGYSNQGNIKESSAIITSQSLQLDKNIKLAEVLVGYNQIAFKLLGDYKDNSFANDLHVYKLEFYIDQIWQKPGNKVDLGFVHSLQVKNQSASNISQSVQVEYNVEYTAIGIVEPFAI